MTKIRPLSDRILVKRSKTQKTKGGILLPDTAKEKPKQGTVIAVGEGKYDESGKLQPVDITAGDEILFGSYAGTEVDLLKQDEDEYLILSESDILAVVAK